MQNPLTYDLCDFYARIPLTMADFAAERLALLVFKSDLFGALDLLHQLSLHRRFCYMRVANLDSACIIDEEHMFEFYFFAGFRLVCFHFTKMVFCHLVLFPATFDNRVHLTS